MYGVVHCACSWEAEIRAARFILSEVKTASGRISPHVCSLLMGYLVANLLPLETLALDVTGKKNKQGRLRPSHNLPTRSVLSCTQQKF